MGHSSHVNKAVFSPDGALVSSAGFSGELCVWDVRSGELVHDLKGHEQSVNGIVFNEEGTVLYSAAKDGYVIEWDVQSGEQLRSIQVDKKGVSSLFIDELQGKLFYSTPKFMVGVLLLKDFTICLEKKATSKNINLLHYCSQINLLAIGGLGEEVTFLSTAGEEVDYLHSAHEMAVMGFKFFDKGKRALSVGYNGEVYEWDLTSHNRSEIVNLSQKAYYSLAVHPDERHFAISLPYAVKLMTREGEERFHFDLKSKGNYALNFSRDGQALALASADKRIRIWTL